MVTADGGVSHVHKVTVLGRKDGLAAVEGDLLDGQKVIVDGGYNLPNGAHVVIDDPASRPSNDESHEEKK